MRLEWRRRAITVLRAAAPLVVMGSIASLLLRYSPGESRFYPRCPVYELLHLRCPGCGATRALAALLRGDFLDAWHENALFLLILPIGAWYGIGRYREWVRGERRGWIQPSPTAVAAALTVAMLFMVIRNVWQLGL